MPPRFHRRILAAAVAGLAAVGLAACGSGSDDTSAAAAPPMTASGAAATVGVAPGGDLGRILVDDQNRTLYLFEKDAGGRSACSGACAADWPPLRSAGKPTAGTGLDAAKLATIARSDGKPQVTYDDHPLYLYAGDQEPGDTNGQALDAFGAPWYVLSPAGTGVTTAPSGGTRSYGY